MHKNSKAKHMAKSICSWCETEIDGSNTVSGSHGTCKTCKAGLLVAIENGEDFHPAQKPKKKK